MIRVSRSAPYAGVMDRATRLLVVEDDPELAAMLTDLLTGEGYAVELAA